MSNELRDLQSRFLHSLLRQSPAVTPHLSPGSEPRLAVYQNGYIARLSANLEASYPALRAHLGETLFAALARGYIGRHPSQHFSLYEFGAAFADFLVETQQGQDGLGLPVDIARYERTVAQVGRRQAWEPMGLERPDPERMLASIQLAAGESVVNPSCQLICLSHDVRELVSALSSGTPGQEIALPSQSPTVLAIWRVGARICAEALDAVQEAFINTHLEVANPSASKSQTERSKSEERPELSWLFAQSEAGLLRPKIIRPI